MQKIFAIKVNNMYGMKLPKGYSVNKDALDDNSIDDFFDYLDGLGEEKEEEEEKCEHKWKTVQMIYTCVEICDKCGDKKDDKK